MSRQTPRFPSKPLITVVEEPFLNVSKVESKEDAQNTHIRPAPTPVEDKFEKCLVSASRSVSRSASVLRKQRPKNLQTSPVHSTTFRAQCTADTVTNVAVRDLFKIPGMICYVVNANYATIAASVRIRCIRVYPGSDDAAIKALICTVNWSSTSTFTRDSEVDATAPYGYSAGQCLEFRPPRESDSSRWYNSGSSMGQNIATVSVENGSVVEIDLDYTLSNNYGNLLTPALSGVATLGALYYGYFDGSSNHALPQLGRPTNY